MSQLSYDELIIPLEEFKEKIKERIDEGNGILEFEVSDEREESRFYKLYSDWHDYNKELLKSSFSNPKNEYRQAYEEVGEPKKRIVKVIGGGPNPEDNYFRRVVNKFHRKVDNLQKLYKKAELLKTNTPVKVKDIEIERDTTKVFIVHGHDEALKAEVARFVEKLGLEAIILHEKASSSATIIEKLEKYANVGYAIILYTPCDEGRKKDADEELSIRARQNVVFELGYFCGKIGRENVCAILKGEIKPPSDLAGVVYIPYDGNWKLDLVREMSASGYDIDSKKLLIR